MSEDYVKLLGKCWYAVSTRSLFCFVVVVIIYMPKFMVHDHAIYLTY